MSYGHGHHRNGRQAELAWTPPTGYLAEQARRIQEMEAEWQQHEDAAVRLTSDLDQALDWWQHNQDAAILTDGTLYAVGAYPAVEQGREDWYQSSPEELEERK